MDLRNSLTEILHGRCKDIDAMLTSNLELLDEMIEEATVANNRTNRSGHRKRVRVAGADPLAGDSSRASNSKKQRTGSKHH
jgi:hypothetical protein